MCNFFISISSAISVKQALEYATGKRTVLREGSSLVTQQVLDPSKFLRKCACADNRAWDLVVRHNLLGVYRFAHVEVDSETFEKKLVMQYPGEEI